MAIVELPEGPIRWPERCCSCGGTEFGWRELSDNPTVWWTPWVRAYRNVRMPIPVCGACWTRSRNLMLAAVAIAGAAWLAASIFDVEQHHLALWCCLAWVAAAALFVRSLAARPMRILRSDPQSGLLKLWIRHDDVARELLGNPRSSGVASEKNVVGTMLLVAIAMGGAMFGVHCLIDWLRR